MKGSLARISMLFLAAYCSVLAQDLASQGVGCDSRHVPKGWRIYVDRMQGFCFQYPSTYKRVPNAVKRSDLVTFQRLYSDAKVFVWVDEKPFDLESFVKSAPTGYVSPPEPIQIGQQTFYYYGPGGGGVSYPDQYFFNLRGKTLYITFDGPYINDKTPSRETKMLERQVLATFSTF